MEWLKHMNNALLYMEENLEDDINIVKVARIAQCSQYHFQRMFSYIVGIPLSEYLRRRKMTKAAFALQSGKKVTDVALSFGYESPTAFNRAFQSVHGFPPSAAKKNNAKFKAFPPVSLQITVKGVAEINYRIVEKEAFRAVGVRKWVEASEEDFFVVDFSIKDEEAVIQFLQSTSADMLGLFVEDNHDGGGYYYLCGETNDPAPDGMYEVLIPTLTWAVFPGVYELSHVKNLFHKIYTQWLPLSNYDIASHIEMEIFSIKDVGTSKYEIWLPVIKT